MTLRHMALIGALLLAHPALAANPEAAGMTADGVAKLDTFIDTITERGIVAGGIAVVERHGEVGYYNTFGKQSRETGAEMAPDTIFRIFSMTKPITSAAAMMLYEEGKIMRHVRHLLSFECDQNTARDSPESHGWYR